MKKPVLAMFVIAAIAIGLLVVLVIGIMNVDEDGREQDGAGKPGGTGTSGVGYLLS
jgi:hypothetical protein